MMDQDICEGGTGASPVRSTGFGDRPGEPLAALRGPIAEGRASPLLFVGARRDWPEPASLAEVRLAGTASPPDAADHIRRMPTLDIVWLSAGETVDSDTIAEICAAAEEGGCNLICETALGALDRVAAAIPASVNVQFLVDADPADRLVALAAARRTRDWALHDVARGDAMERIDRLQEEVARISRLLGDLATRSGGLSGVPTGFTPHGEEVADYPGQVRAPTRDYAAMPRSFVPEERMLDRQRAKQVRRMLRQRRMREQYFPADLFADPAWDMLLDLYAARLERQPVSVSSLCIAAAVPATTALRWIKTMTDAGLFVREADPHDGRRIFIALAEGACDALARYFEALEE
jgi:DNA-binding MarR family transcriptional regulator